MSSQPDRTAGADEILSHRPTGLAWRVLPYFVTAAIFAVILYYVPVNKTWGALMKVPVLTFLAIFLPLAMLYLVIDSLCLAWVFRRFNGPIRFRDVVPMRASMYLPALVNNQLGFAGLAFYLRRKHGVGFLEGLSSVLYSSFIDVYEIFIFSGVGMLFYVPHQPRLRSLVVTMRVVYAAAWIFLAALIVVAAIARRKPAVSAWIRHTRLGAFAGSFLKATPLDYMVLFAVKGGGFACALAATYATLQIYGIDVPAAKLAALLPIVYLAAAIPITVAQLGPAQGVWIVLFNNNGQPDQLLAYGIAVHLIFMASIAAIGTSFLRRASRDLAPSGR